VKEFYEKKGLISFRRWLPYILCTLNGRPFVKQYWPHLCVKERMSGYGKKVKNLYMIRWLG
jgi:hypothetical protein